MIASLCFRIKRKLSTLIVSRKTKVNGKQVRIPIIDGSSCDSSEPWMLDLLKCLFFNIKDGAFLDVGVNLGQTLVKVKSICLSKRYVGIEPNSFCVSYVRRLIALNKYPDAVIVPAALFDKPQILDLLSYSREASDPAASIVQGFRDGDSVRGSVCVVAASGEQLLSYLGQTPISIIKIDVEGAELECLLSLEMLIRSQNPTVLVEILPSYSSANVLRIERQQKIELFCRRNDYLIFSIAKRSGNRLSCLNHVKSIDVHSDLDKCDYLLVPGEQVASRLKGLKVQPLYR